MGTSGINRQEDMAEGGNWRYRERQGHIYRQRERERGERGRRQEGELEGKLERDGEREREGHAMRGG